MKILTSAALLFAFILSGQVSFAQVGDYDNNQNVGSCVIIQNNLRLRSKDSSTGGDVSELQSFLQDRGFLNSEPTGYFGQVTFAAVKQYQFAKGLAGTGYVGPLTRSKIQADSCNITPNPTPLPTYPISCNTEYRSCNDGTPMPRDADCTWRADRCNFYNGTNNLQDYNMDMSIYSVSAGRYLNKSYNNYFDATDIDGTVNFFVTTSIPNVSCTTSFRNNDFAYSYSYQNNYSYVGNKNFSQNYDKNGLGLDYYKVSCGDGINFKRIEKEFVVETRSPSYYNNNSSPVGSRFCPVNSFNSSEDIPVCICQTGYKTFIGATWNGSLLMCK